MIIILQNIILIVALLGLIDILFFNNKKEKING